MLALWMMSPALGAADLRVVDASERRDLGSLRRAL
jgi:hypothetical protein